MRSLLSAIDIDARDVALAVGVWCLAYGVHQVYPPAGWMVVGAALVWVTVPTRPFPIVFVRDRQKKAE